MPLQIYHQQVEPATPQLDTPKVASVVPDAFGEKVYESQAKIGETGTKIAGALQEHIAQQQLWQDQAKLYTAKEDFRTQIDNLQRGDGTATIKDSNGQDMEVPAGYLNRQGFSTRGATEDYTQKISQLKSSYISQFKDHKIQAIALRELNTLAATGRNQVSAHEAAQTRKATSDTFLASVGNDVKSAADALNTDELSKSVDLIKGGMLRWGAYNGASPEVINLKTSEQVAKAVGNASISTLQRTGDINQALGILESQKKDLQPDDYNKIYKSLSVGATHIQRTNERIQQQQMISNESQWMSSLAAGKLSWANMDDIAGAVRDGQISEKFGLAMTDALKTNGDYQPAKAENENYPAFADSIFEAKDQVELNKALLGILQNHKNISQEKLAVLINSAINRGKALPLNTKQGDDASLAPMQVAVDSAMKSAVDYYKKQGSDNPDIISNYLHGVQNGKSPSESLQEAMTAHKIKKNPSNVQYQIGQVIFNPKSGASAEVIGFNEDGVPMVRVKGGTKPKQP